MLRRGIALCLLTWSVLGSLHSGHAQPAATDAPVSDALGELARYSIPAAALRRLHDRNGRMLWGDPLLGPPYGWFFAVQVNVVGPAVRQEVTRTIPVGSKEVSVLLPPADLSWTGAPELEVGYRLPDAVGELSASYRLLATQGSGIIPGFDAAGAGALRSRLDAQTIFLDYTSHDFALWPSWPMKAHVGVCLPDIYFDSHAQGALRAMHVSSQYFGAGPHLGFDFWHALPVPGLELYARVSGVLTVGKVHQRFEVTDAALEYGEDSLRKVREVPMAHFQVGLSYAPPLPNQQLRLLAGYTWERWWYLAQTDDSRGELTVQGVFVRAEWRY